MPRISQVQQAGIRYRGGFRGSYIEISRLIDGKVKFDIVDFTEGESCVRNCERYCRMQIRIGGKLFVTWHSSELITEFLQECKAHQEETGEVMFPLEECVITVGDDRGYYLQDAQTDAVTPTDKELEEMVNKSKKRR